MSRAIKTAKQKAEMKRLTEEHEKLLYFTVKGVPFKMVGTRKCKNGTWQHDIKNLNTNVFGVIGAKELDKILNNK